MKAILIVLILSVTLILAPLSRVISSLTPDQATTHNDVWIAQHAGLTALGQIQAANQGPYVIRGFRHPTCFGSIALLPLYRNAEGAQILKQMISAQGTRYGVIFQGRLYDQFPQINYTKQKLIKGTQRLLGIEQNASLQIMAFAEQGPCKIAEKLAEQHASLDLFRRTASQAAHTF